MTRPPDPRLLAQRIDAVLREVGVRAVLLQEEIDRRFTAAQLQMDQRFSGAELAVNIALTAAEKAVLKAENASERRFDSVNEFRRALSDQAATFLPRAEYDSAHDSLTDRVNGNADRLAALELRLTSRLDTASGREGGHAETRTEQRLNISQVIAALAVVAAVVSIILLVIQK